MKYLILSSDKPRAISVFKKLKNLPVFDTYIASCVGAVIAVFFSVRDDESISEFLNCFNNYNGLTSFLPMVKKIDISKFYQYAHHEAIIYSDIEVRVPLLNLSTKELKYFIINKLSYKDAVGVLQASIQQVWDKPVSIDNSIFIEPSIYDSHCFYHVLSYDKANLPSEVNVLFPVKKEQADSEKWKYKGNKSLINRLLFIVKSRNIQRCHHEIITLAEANSIGINYHYLD